jgi:prolyl oligopeptidase
MAAPHRRNDCSAASAPCGYSAVGDSVSLQTAPAPVTAHDPGGFMSRTQTWPKRWLRSFPVNIFNSGALAWRTRLILHASLAALACATVAAAQEHSNNSVCPPPTRKDATVETLHGVSIPDPYRWLEDQDSPETRAWIEAENRCTAAVLTVLPGRELITKRLSDLQKTDSFTVPLGRSGDYFFTKRAADQDLFVLCRRHGLEGADEILLDPQGLSPDHSTSISLMGVSADASLVAYGVRVGGQDEITIHFLETKTRRDLPEQLPQANYYAVDFEPSSRALYYARTTPEGPRVFHHVIGTPSTSDPEIFGKGFGPEKIITAQVSQDGRDLLITVVYGSGSTRTELYFKDLRSGSDTPVRPVVNDTDSLFFGEVQAGKLILYTNWKAPKWHIFSVELGNPRRESWKEIIPESDAAFEAVALYGNKIFVQYVRNVVSQLKIFDVDGKPAGEVHLPSLGAVSGSSGVWNSQNVFLSFESFNIPTSLYRYDAQSGSLQPWVSPKVPIDPNAYTVEQVWYESKDKTRVPMFLFYKKGLTKDGSRPTWLTGYGGFNVNLTPGFYAPAVEWADAGGVYAQPNLRGGGEFGEAWHQAGMKENKQNVFDDFLAAGEWLIANHYTSSKELAIEGGSNGGLLVGASLTQRPDLFRAVICEYPLLDMLRYQKFMKGSFWVPEYGSADVPAEFKYLRPFSPYHNVKDATNYPAVLFITGDGDTRVAPLHARKMTARLQAANASKNPILILYDTKSGHSGGRPLGKQIEEETDTISFLFSQLGVNPH